MQYRTRLGVLAVAMCAFAAVAALAERFAPEPFSIQPATPLAAAGPVQGPAGEPTTSAPAPVTTPTSAPAPVTTPTSAPAPVTTPTTQVPSALSGSGPFCGARIVELVAAMLDPHQILHPEVAVGATERAYYDPSSMSLVFAECETPSVVAHELGHYVHHLASGSFGAMVDDALSSFCPGGSDQNGRCAEGWIRGQEHYPGIEHAAHCIGQVLWRNGTYTKCPNPTLLEAARERVGKA